MAAIFTGRPETVIPRAAVATRRLIASYNIVRFRIGRTNDLATRQDSHDSILGRNSDLGWFYETPSIDFAQQVEEALLRQFSSHPKFFGVASDSRGNVSKGMQYVYLFLWAKAGLSIPDFTRDLLSGYRLF